MKPNRDDLEGSLTRPQLASGGRTAPHSALAALAVLLLWAAAVSAQEMEPRAYSPAPIGLNFAGVVYSRSTGNVLTDPTLPLDNVSARLNGAALAYSRTFGLWGRQASVAAVVPWVWGTVEGDVFEEFTSVDRSGLADPRLRFSVNLFGGKAMTPQEFAARTPGTSVGATVILVLPLGEYMEDKLVNLGSNRWSAKAEVGLSQPLGKWTFDVYPGVWYFTDNDEFYGGVVREQEPVYGLQAHVAYTFRPGLWLAVNGTAYRGGRTTVDGVDKDDAQDNTRAGLTLAVPVNRAHSLKASWSTGASTRLGSDFDSYAIAWQMRWMD